MYLLPWAHCSELIKKLDIQEQVPDDALAGEIFEDASEAALTPAASSERPAAEEMQTLVQAVVLEKGAVKKA